jgi:polysaccharide deacetylase 2 family uncharacterized protein YibQ
VFAGKHGACALNGDALATLETAALKHEAAGAGGHPRDETVNALAALFLWLVRSL